MENGLACLPTRPHTRGARQCKTAFRREPSTATSLTVQRLARIAEDLPAANHPRFHRGHVHLRWTSRLGMVRALLRRRRKTALAHLFMRRHGRASCHFGPGWLGPLSDAQRPLDDRISPAGFRGNIVFDARSIRTRPRLFGRRVFYQRLSPPGWRLCYSAMVYLLPSYIVGGGGGLVTAFSMGLLQLRSSQMAMSCISGLSEELSSHRNVVLPETRTAIETRAGGRGGGPLWGISNPLSSTLHPYTLPYSLHGMRFSSPPPPKAVRFEKHRPSIAPGTWQKMAYA